TRSSRTFDSTMTGRSLVAGDSRSSSSTSMPLMAGISTSSRMNENRSRPINWSACTPSAHSEIVHGKCWVNILLTAKRVALSSSQTSTCIELFPLPQRLEPLTDFALETAARRNQVRGFRRRVDLAGAQAVVDGRRQRDDGARGHVAGRALDGVGDAAHLLEVAGRIRRLEVAGVARQVGAHDSRQLADHAGVAELLHHLVGVELYIAHRLSYPSRPPEGRAIKHCLSEAKPSSSQ